MRWLMMFGYLASVSLFPQHVLALIEETAETSQPEVVESDDLTEHEDGADAELDLIPNLSVDIPGVNFTKPLEENGILTIDFLGEYIAGVYTYILGIGTTIAIILIMIAGLRYTLAAGTDDVKGAQTMIVNAITGVVLLLSVYLVLFIVNPQTTFLKSIELELIARQSLILASGDAEGDFSQGYLDFSKEYEFDKTVPEAQPVSESNPPLKKGVVLCPESGDAAQIIESFYGNATYRFGAKGGKPPYKEETKNDSSGTAYNTYCPSGTVCVDCSGYVALARKCAGLPSKGSSTKQIFQNAPKIASCTATTVTTTDGKTHTLVAGDLLGWPPGDQSFTKYGHAMIYTRPNRLLEATGSREPGGKAVGEVTLTTICTSTVLRYAGS